MAILIGPANSREMVSIRATGVMMKLAEPSVVRLIAEAVEVSPRYGERMVIVGTTDRIADVIFGTSPRVLERAVETGALVS